MIQTDQPLWLKTKAGQTLFEAKETGNTIETDTVN